MSDPIKIEGLKEFQKQLRTIEDGLQKQLRVALNQGADIIVDAATKRMPRRTGAAIASIKAQSSQREARVIGGSKKAPYVGWLEFGGKVGRDKKTKRPFIKGGRYVFPAFGAHRDEVLEIIVRELDALARDAGMEVHGGG